MFSEIGRIAKNRQSGQILDQQLVKNVNNPG